MPTWGHKDADSVSQDSSDLLFDPEKFKLRELPLFVFVYKLKTLQYKRNIHMI